MTTNIINGLNHYTTSIMNGVSQGATYVSKASEAGQEKVSQVYREAIKAFHFALNTVSHFIQAINITALCSFYGMVFGMLSGLYQAGIYGVSVGGWVGGLLGMAIGFAIGIVRFAENVRKDMEANQSP